MPERYACRLNLGSRRLHQRKPRQVWAGAGGQALGLQQADFDHAALVELDPHGCGTLRRNRPSWNVLEQGMHLVDLDVIRRRDPSRRPHSRRELTA
jgi:site-specific DNA-cytosine methylase